MKRRTSLDALKKEKEIRQQETKALESELDSQEQADIEDKLKSLEAKLDQKLQTIIDLLIEQNKNKTNYQKRN